MPHCRRHPASYFACLAALVVGWSAQSACADDSQEGLELFEKTIRPVLVAHCIECHAGSEEAPPEGGFRVDSRDSLRAGGESGAAIVPGRPDESLLVEALRYESLEMPPNGQLDDEVVADFERWIELGAPDPRDAPPPSADDIATRAKAHWAYQPVKRHEPPPVADAAWPRTDIDRFVRARLEAAGITPVAPADDWTLVRRIYIDLTGLVPTPEQTLALVSDTSTDRIERLVDRLLNEPEFGERWGRHWLDVARFAESAGGGRSVMFRNAWRYRDYVIAAFNDDKPYDEFVREQIAGDLLPPADDLARRARLIATGFLAIGPKNLDSQDKELLRMDVVDEQLDTIGRAMLGLAIGCARCHDHKWDPITTRDYYAMAGILRSTKTLTPGNVSGFVEVPLPVDAEWQAALDAHASKLADLEERVKTANDELARHEGRLRKLHDALLTVGVVVDDSVAKLNGDWQSSSSVSGYVGERYLHDGNTGKGDKTATFNAELAESGEYALRLFFTPADNRATNTPVVVRHANGETAVTVNQRWVPDGGRFAALGAYRFDDMATVTISTEGTDGHVIADAVQFVPIAAATLGDAASPELPVIDSQLAANITATKATIAQLDAERKILDCDAPPPQPEAMVVRDEETIEDCPLCIRGDVHQLGDAVPRAAIAALGPTIGNAFGDTSGRAELAEWLTSPENPLTARVIANRVWHHLVGIGLVRSVDDFGTTGENPSHPELLDTLAADFMDDGWSLKRLVRRIMLSRVYQLSSHEDAAAVAVDPENRLLWRMNRRRAEAEVIRDTMLAVAGELDRQRGGVTIADDTESEFGYVFTSHRRSVYLPVFRNATPDVLEVFDFANSNLVVGRRTRSTLPSQSLFLLNSPLAQDMATTAAGRLLSREGLDDAARAQRVWLETLVRPPLADELSLALARVAEARATSSAETDQAELAAWASIYHGLFCCLDYQYVR
jgi:mono/diheme cytochrome c family protein